MLKAGQSLLAGTVALLISNIFVKGLGFFYRVVLVRLLGAEGMGLIEMTTPVYAFLLVLAGWGLPLAISQKTAEASAGSHYQGALSIFKSGRAVLFVSGAAVMVLAFLSLPLLIKYIVPDERIYACLKTILPAVMIISIASAYRGHFQGMRQISTLGISQCVEQAVRVSCGLFLAGRLLNLGLETAVTAVSYATVLGEGAGFLFLLWRFQRNKQYYGAEGIISGRQILSLIKFGTPVTVNRLAISSIMMLEAILIPVSLQIAGWDMRSATEMYGRFSGVALTLLNLPGVFTGALAVSVLPAVAGSGLRNRALLQNHASNSLQATAVLTLPGMALLYLFSEQLCTWIFHSPLAAEPLRILTWGGCFLYLNITLTSILQGLGEVRALLVNSLLAGACFITGITLLTPLPSLGIQGAAIATNIYYLAGFSLNALLFKRVSKLGLPWRNILLKPACGGALGILALMLASRFSPNFFSGADKFSVLISALLFCLVYFIFLLLSRGLSIGVWRRFRDH